MDLFGRRASLLKNVYPFQKKDRTPYAAIISDNQKTLGERTCPVKLFFNLRIFNNLRNINTRDLFFPLLLHPDYLFPGLEKEVYAQGPNNNRKIAALFIGNVDPSYNRDITRDLFRINTRYELFYHIQNSLPGDTIYSPPSLDDFLTKIGGGELKNKIVLLNIRRFSIPQRLWFKILLDSEFFIHLAGSLQPYCHNHIESMLAGCIPVTAFSSFYIPPFEDKVNALLFNTPEELTGVLTGISRGEYGSLAPSIRGNVLDYYKNHYSFDSFKVKLSQLGDSKNGFSNYYIHCEVVAILNELKQTTNALW
jgi:hypothetical protein